MTTYKLSLPFVMYDISTCFYSIIFLNDYVLMPITTVRIIEYWFSCKLQYTLTAKSALDNYRTIGIIYTK